MHTFKVINATPRHDGKSLCETCRHAQVVRGYAESQVMVRCGMSYGHGDLFYPGMLRVPFPVSECSAYDDKRLPSLKDFEKRAWIIEPRTRVKGFVPTVEAITEQVEAIVEKESEKTT